MNTQMLNLNSPLELGLYSNACLESIQPMLNTVYYHYPSWSWQNQPSKIEQSFKIVGKLIQKKIIKLETVNDFVETVNEVAELL